ncbi:hypothetical protein PAAG_08890 [Paracoccidioides lutzii Pb01]|uniref:Uncharacterized protein n=1 Tax=Paracoccidioides lutzii (strain ATCC MYA-826 / Pb01) TaxID=502779 RepID=C1HDN3_PARBA|nr:hypothetical protein PAAG_08890 [Paracoccidioides lutzii Pb01]EEH40027.2 hypothetical protein PAAG_08890 [Paracoccidioides lutzii Pb01]
MASPRTRNSKHANAAEPIPTTVQVSRRASDAGLETLPLAVATQRVMFRLFIATSDTDREKEK